jgi:pimeloyl-ACP methyl ester carboxylesterase
MKRTRRRTPAVARAATRATDLQVDRQQFLAYSYRDDQIEEALVTGKDAPLLESYFGEGTYQELRDLARQARDRRARGGPRVLILPGIMGSTIGKPRTILDDVIWLDPIDIAAGRLVKLALNGTSPYLSLGVVPLAYIALKLKLTIAGYDVDFHHYDWRRSLDDLGAELATRLKNETANEVQLVAHSMGGLVVRAAAAHKAPKIKRVIMLGTPNHGSFAPAQAIRAVYSVVKQVAAIDPFHDAQTLSRDVFSTFPGLYQMLPTTEKFSAVNLYDSQAWPKGGPQPRQDLLGRVQAVQQFLAKADDRFFLIAGVNEETVVGLRMENDEFVYDQSLEGDGTVPLAFCELAGAKTYYVRESHGSLPNNLTVGRAVNDLLKNGTTTELPDHVPDQRTPIRRGVTRSSREMELRAPAYGGREGSQLTQGEIRHALEPLVAPVERDEVAPAIVERPGLPTEDRGYGHEFDRIVVGRRRQHRIDLRLSLGSITEVDARAVVLGVFRNVTPSGPAQALDQRLNGAIRDFTMRRMFSANVGELFMMPTGRHPLRADFILFAGLGDFDRFSESSETVLEITAENVIRACVRTNVEEFATVLFGAGSGHEVGRTLRHLLTGFFRGLRSADTERCFRRIVVCEFDRDRYEAIKGELLRLSSTALFDDIEVMFDEQPLPPPMITAEPARGLAGMVEAAYLLVRQDAVDVRKKTMTLSASVLTQGAKAAVVGGAQTIEEERLDALLERIESPNFTPDTIEAFGKELGKLILPADVALVLSQMKGRHLVVVHDAPSSRIPWEAIWVDSWCPASDKGLSRRYVAENLSVAKWLEQRQQDAMLHLLLVVNPTLDLPGAESEGNRVRELFGAHPSVKVDELRGPQATKRTLLEKFRSGAYDVIHYAGHAFFDPLKPSNSGILCHGKDVLSGADLATIGNLPSLVFFNACEAGRLRRGAPGRPGMKRGEDKKRSVKRQLEESVGLAEAFLRGGVANYLGTYWPVGDAPAKRFAETFYTDLLNGYTIGEALLDGRKKVEEEGSVDWADYIHYGSYDFVLKQKT